MFAGPGGHGPEPGRTLRLVTCTRALIISGPVTVPGPARRRAVKIMPESSRCLLSDCHRDRYDAAAGSGPSRLDRDRVRATQSGWQCLSGLSDTTD